MSISIDIILQNIEIDRYVYTDFSLFIFFQFHMYKLLKLNQSIFSIKS